MNKLIRSVQDQLSLDNIKYYQNFTYQNSVYANMEFPEVGGIDIFSITSNPAKNSSQQTRKEIEYLSDITSNRSSADIELVYLVDTDPLLLFYPLIEKLNIVFNKDLFTRIYNLCLISIVDHLKFFYNRARPFQIAEKLDIPLQRIITKTHHTASYPSGHTMYAALAAEILKDEYPDHGSKFEEQTARCAFARELQGVHYPSDNNASIKIVKTIFPNLKQYYTGEPNEL